jgi:hypothetical protein
MGLQKNIVDKDEALYIQNVSFAKFQVKINGKDVPVLNL